MQVNCAVMIHAQQGSLVFAMALNMEPASSLQWNVPAIQAGKVMPVGSLCVPMIAQVRNSEPNKKISCST